MVKYLKNQIKHLMLIFVVFITLAQSVGCSNGHNTTSAVANSIALSSSAQGDTANITTKENVSNEEYSAIVKSSDNSISEESQELWIKYPNGKEDKLVAYKHYEDVKKITQGINGIFNPQLSPDKSKIYFLTHTWVTSDAVHVVDIKTKSEKYICPGNSLEVLQSGSFKGKLIVNQHRYYDGGGSYDHYFLVDEQGKVIKEFGEVLDEKAKEQLK